MANERQLTDGPVEVTVTPDFLHEEIKKTLDHLNTLLNLCQEDGGECLKCAKIICPYKDDLHFHHDGCPSCASGQKIN